MSKENLTINKIGNSNTRTSVNVIQEKKNFLTTSNLNSQKFQLHFFCECQAYLNQDYRF